MSSKEVDVDIIFRIPRREGKLNWENDKELETAATKYWQSRREAYVQLKRVGIGGNSWQRIFLGQTCLVGYMQWIEQTLTQELQQNLIFAMPILGEEIRVLGMFAPRENVSRAVMLYQFMKHRTRLGRM